MIKILVEKKHLRILIILLFVFLLLGVVVSQEFQFAHEPNEIQINIDGGDLDLQTAINVGKFNGLAGANQLGSQCRFCINECNPISDYPNKAGYIGHKSKAYGGGTCEGGLSETNSAWFCCK